jgi:hypothetical protein
MPLPMPVLTPVVVNDHTLKLTVGGSGNVTYHVYGRRGGKELSEHLGSRTGEGDLFASNLESHRGYIVWCVAEDNTGYSLPVIQQVSLLQTDSLTGAIVAKFDTQPELLAACPGGIWTGEVPEDQEPTYVYLEVGGTTYLYTFAGSYVERTEVTVSFIGTAESVERAKDAFQASYDWASLPLTRGELTQVLLLGNDLRSESMRWKDGTLVFRGRLVYEVMVTKRQNRNCDC